MFSKLALCVIIKKQKDSKHMNLLEIGKILRPHGIKGAVKVECYVDEHFSMFKDVMITNKLAKAQVKNVQNLNKDFYIVTYLLTFFI